VVIDDGPVLITENDDYQGESLLENDLLQNEDIMFPFSVNLECKVTFSVTKEYFPSKMEIIGGQLIFTTCKITTTRYLLNNCSDKEIELALDHNEAFNQEIEGVKPIKIRETASRFFVMLPHKKNTPFNIPQTSLYVSNPNTKLLGLTRFEVASQFVQGNMSTAGYQHLIALFDRAEHIGKSRSQLLEQQQNEAVNSPCFSEILFLINIRSLLFLLPHSTLSQTRNVYNLS